MKFRVLGFGVCRHLWSISLTSWNGHKHFITFKDKCSHYGYLYWIHEKLKSMDMFKIYKAEVENQQNRKIKAFRSSRGGGTMENTMNQVDVKDLLSIFKTSVVL